VAACERAGVPLLVVRRPGWAACDGDDWLRVPGVQEAAATVRRVVPAGSAVLLTLGRGGLAAFATDRDRHYVVRAVDPPAQQALPRQHTVVLGRGPFALDAERALLRAHDVRLLVTKDSGGAATAAKLVAARELGIPVVMVDRPPLPDGVGTVATVEDAQTWVLGILRVSRSDPGAR
jgi:precorrin-6A/cobalt-precorrin-6A reductase